MSEKMTPRFEECGHRPDRVELTVCDVREGEVIEVCHQISLETAKRLKNELIAITSGAGTTENIDTLVNAVRDEERKKVELKFSAIRAALERCKADYPNFGAFANRQLRLDIEAILEER